MCKVFNIVGSLNDIECHLNNNNLNEFNSLDELISFQKEYYINRQHILLNHKSLIEKEKYILEKEISELTNLIVTCKQKFIEQKQKKLDELKKPLENFQAITGSKVIFIIKNYYSGLSFWLKIRLIHITFYFKVFLFTRKSNKQLSIKNSRFSFITQSFDKAVEQSSSLELQTLERKNKIINEINSSIYGAIGEQKVSEILKSLSDDYILINDYSCSFHNPIYNRSENDYIKSIQIDHLLISPSGIFIIETKNWSEYSIDNIDLRSPVKQVKRTSFALFKILGEINTSNFILKKHHWGDRKIPIRNIIVFTNKKPIEEFQFIKILSLNGLLQYVKYFEPTFSQNEIQSITDFLLKISNKKTQSSKLKI